MDAIFDTWRETVEGWIWLFAVGAWSFAMYKEGGYLRCRKCNEEVLFIAIQ